MAEKKAAVVAAMKTTTINGKQFEYDGKTFRQWASKSEADKAKRIDALIIEKKWDAKDGAALLAFANATFKEVKPKKATAAASNSTDLKKASLYESHTAEYLGEVIEIIKGIKTAKDEQAKAEREAVKKLSPELEKLVTKGATKAQLQAALDALK